MTNATENNAATTATENTIEIFGNVGSISPLRQTNTKRVPVLNFTVAVNGEAGQTPTWYEIVLFGNRATKYAAQLGKGSFVRVAGPARVETFERKNGQGTGSKNVIVARGFGHLKAKQAN